VKLLLFIVTVFTAGHWAGWYEQRQATLDAETDAQISRAKYLLLRQKEFDRAEPQATTPEPASHWIVVSI
jgi:hypothetical protein